MAELDTNQDELLEAGQPDAKAEKGDKTRLSKVPVMPLKLKAEKLKSLNPKKILLTKLSVL